jgi:copper chaperone CopZ
MTNKNSTISFSVSSIECIACTPVFKRELQKLSGIKDVKPFVMTNMIKLEIDPRTVTVDEVKKEILNIVARAGFAAE